MTDIVLSCRQLSKQFIDGDRHTHVLNTIDLSIQRGERIAILGSSGSGKSTLLHLLGGLDTPSSGQIELNGQDINALSVKALSRLRNKSLGFVYQFHHLLPEFDAVENVAMPLLINGVKAQQAQKQAIDLLAQVGLAERVNHKPGELSGGERQRAALARALITEPDCLLADEPTGNLDQNTASIIFDLMLELNARHNTALIIVTHDTVLAERMDRQLLLSSGRLTAK